ncbi:MAG TPA: ABC transporter permease [Gemmataceae bacterium]|jgi:ABC-type transport system involved in multi-copper enzyme maturation permease subunit|nr:ABC transporter permease [Gemmataceae bacterium]
MFNLTANEWVTLGVLGAVLLTALAVGLALLGGLFQARSLVRREFSAYFLSPIAYVVLVVFLAVTGHLFYVTLGLLTASGPRGAEWPMQTMFADERFWLVFLFIPPLLTMRLFAEERSSGTLEMLMTAPLRDWQVVLAKYLACLAFYAVLWLPTLVYLPALLGAQRPIYPQNLDEWRAALLPYGAVFLGGLVAVLLGLLLLWPRVGTRARALSLALLVGGAVVAAVGGWLHYHGPGPYVLEVPVAGDPYPVLATYLGMFLAGAMFLAVGLLVSSRVQNQMVAALVSLGLGLVFIVAGFWRPEQDGGLGYQLLYFFSVPLHFDRAFTRGLVDTRPVLLYASTAIFCLFLTVRSVEARRWQ